MKNLSLILMILFSVYVSGQTITLSDLAPTGVHSMCIYNETGFLKSCYNQTIDFSDSMYNENNHIYYLKIIPNKLDIGLSGTNMITYIAAIIPLGLFLLFIAAIIGLCLVIVFMFLRRRGS